MSYKLLTNISQRNQYTCYGWIRRKENILKLSPIHDLIKVLCILYFRDDEIFNNIGQSDKSIVLSPNKKILSRKNRDLMLNQTHFYNNNHGINEINSHQQIIIQWNLKVNDIDGGNTLIGITNKDDHVDQYIDDGNTIYYLFQYNKKWINHGVCRFYHRDNDDEDSINDRYGTDYLDRSISTTDGDMLSLHLDLKQKKLKLIVNGVDFGFASSLIMTSPQIQYKLCVIFDSQSIVEILDFKIY